VNFLGGVDRLKPGGKRAGQIGGKRGLAPGGTPLKLLAGGRALTPRNGRPAVPFDQGEKSLAP